MCKTAIENNEIRLKSDGSPQRDFIHGDDVARAINILINYKKKDLSIEFQGNYTGERPYQELDDNWEPVDITLNGFFDIDIGLHHLFPIKTHQLTLNLIIQNILDQNTDFFPDYPGPKRRIKLGIELIL